MKYLIITISFLLLSTNGFAQSTTYSKDAFGHTVEKDEYGNVKATYSTNASGDV